jgi:hypothetical protein
MALRIKSLRLTNGRQQVSNNLKPATIERAINLSAEKYCIAPWSNCNRSDSLVNQRWAILLTR